MILMNSHMYKKIYKWQSRTILRSISGHALRAGSHHGTTELNTANTSPTFETSNSQVKAQTVTVTLTCSIHLKERSDVYI
jgi:hypothetical protein